MATIRDVAKLAGVAISTASAAINRSAPVSEEVIAKVEEAVREIGYVPHGAAQSLRSGQSRLIGLIVPNISNPHFSAVAHIIENACLNAGYLSMAFSTGQDSERESQILRMLRQQRVAGLIIIPTRSDAAHGERLARELHVPTVLLDMYVEGLPHDVLKLDNVAASRIATEHLIRLGHRRIAVLTGIPGLITSEDRLAGYLEAHRRAGIDVDPALLLAGDFKEETARASVRAVMTGAMPPTALVSINNMMTMGALHALRELGLRAPADVSFVGIDDFDFADLIDPPLTVVRVPVAEMTVRSIEVLLDEIAGKRPPTGRVEVFQPTLVVRESARAV
ncbi:LacI family DNA-binding transcriptional regulator [Devosia nitrariae]|uniref:LacI family transcriptional regulator n=1 Tax=Devosia nitrariae TaxID=2071872 RepID=A0ABQ5W9L5_9HYPH|nr:LacI family DNA-binding transcriptional regulator [Devosia nitrariae]GLQ56408.1 LacI family transcriptional regulator [Devosia nitrariae]